MNFEPQKFFVGLVDFFSIFMPGALAVSLTKDWAARQIGLEKGFPIQDTADVAVFLFAAYLVGHLVFLIGAKLLDDYVYDPIRNATTIGQTNRLADGKCLSFRPVRTLASSSLLFGEKADKALTVALRSRSRFFQDGDAAGAVNAFQWSKARLSKENPEGLATVHRFEADSKFFRSFVVLLFVIGCVLLVQHRFLLAGACVVFLLPSLWRYGEQRFKATQQAYWYVMTLGTDGVGGRTSDGLTHAGGVVCRKNDKGQRTYLLVTAKRDREQWVLPKGHIEPYESAEQTAIREIHEESEHWARPREDALIGDFWLGPQPNAPYTRFILMDLMEEPKKWRRPWWRRRNCVREPKRAEGRKHEWLTLDAATAKLPSEAQAVLEEADRMLKAQGI
jgi:8-oxo-dGTP pyrophosphatase MutT (NUDIX family)